MDIDTSVELQQAPSVAAPTVVVESLRKRSMHENQQSHTDDTPHIKLSNYSTM
jgi:hypothetical protein